MSDFLVTDRYVWSFPSKAKAQVFAGPVEKENRVEAILLQIKQLSGEELSTLLAKINEECS